MAYETILYDVSDGVATITLNRPDKYNALTMPMYKEIQQALKDAERDTSVRALVLTGAGKGFCSGADLLDLQSQLGIGEVNVGDVLRSGLNRIAVAMRQMEKPIICAVNGVAAGAGAGLALAADIRLASDQASFVFAAFVNIGIIPDAGTTYFLPQLVGVSRAFELATTADAQNRLVPERALEMGIVNQVLPHENFLDDVNAYARNMAEKATYAVGLTKRAMYKAVERSLADALETEAQLQIATFKTQDFREGVQAFIEKRSPKFTGQ